MTTEEKFNAAVNVIRNLPKNGAYQPSHDLKLRFYAYFKQATDGPCTIPKPAFWDIIGRSKYEAWKKLGNMSKKEAMESYVEELKKIVETMSYNDNVGMFLGSLGNFYDNVPVEDIEMLLGPVIERMKSQPGSPLQNSPLGSRETSPTRIPRHLVNKPHLSSLETSPLSSMSASPQPPDTDDEDEEFIDTVETTPHALRKVYKNEAVENGPKMNGHGPVRNGKLAGGEEEEEEGKLSPNPGRRRAPAAVKANGGPVKAFDLSEPLREAVLHLQKDLDRITARVRSLEVAMLSHPQYLGEVESRDDSDGETFEDCIDVLGMPPSPPQPPTSSSSPGKSWFPELSRSTLVFVVLWPFFAHFLIRFWQMRKVRNCKVLRRSLAASLLPFSSACFFLFVAGILVF